jgi:hypothetical protein
MSSSSLVTLEPDVSSCGMPAVALPDFSNGAKRAMYAGCGSPTAQARVALLLRRPELKRDLGATRGQRRG